MSLESNIAQGVKTDPVFVSLPPAVPVLVSVARSPVTVSLAAAALIVVSVAEFFPDPVLGTLDELEAASAGLHALVNVTLPNLL